MHDSQPTRTAGAPLDEARAALVLLHGRGATAESMLALLGEIGADGVAALAPQADALGGVPQWYPRSFLAPLDANEPFLSAAIDAVTRTVETIAATGIPSERILLLGFSQGACLALEAAARQAQRWGGVVALSGGLIGTGPGPDGVPALRGMGGAFPDKAFDYEGDLAGTPVFLGCSDIDPHIPLARVERSAAVLSALGAEVDQRIYPGFGHAVNTDEMEAVRAMVAGLG